MRVASARAILRRTRLCCGGLGLACDRPQGGVDHGGVGVRVVVTADDIGAVAIFAALGPADRERLSRAAADITLMPGEYAAHEGSERALFAVLEGRVEPVKLVDGIGRVVGERRPGDIFGEVPIVLGTVFPVGFRAAEKSRVMRVEANDYHAVAAEHPDVSKEVGRLAGHRIGGLRGLQGIAAEPPPPRAIVVGHLGRVLRGVAALSRPQPDHVQVAHARRARCGRVLGRPPAGRRRLPDDPCRQREDRGATAAPPGG